MESASVQEVSRPHQLSLPSQAASNFVTASVTEEFSLAGLNAVDPQTAPKALATARHSLLQAEPTVASRSILEWLETGKDGRTAQGFSPGPDGFLREAPSTRTFLLDIWPAVDAEAAGNYAERIFDQSDSPDEWSLALRNRGKQLGRQGAEDAGFAQRVWQHLTRAHWQRQPTEGYLHGFDAAVFVGRPELGAVLAQLINEPPHPATAYAARLALDRMVNRNFASIMGLLRSEPESMARAPRIRAELMGRANLGKTYDRSIVEEYLRDPRISSAEKQSFLRIYPNPHHEVSFNLLTIHDPPSLVDLAMQDRASLPAVQGWRETITADLQPGLAELVARLENFHKSAQRGLSQVICE